MDRVKRGFLKKLLKLPVKMLIVKSGGAYIVSHIALNGGINLANAACKGPAPPCPKSCLPGDKSCTPASPKPVYAPYCNLPSAIWPPPYDVWICIRKMDAGPGF